MKPSILIVMLDFLVCSLLFFVVGPEGTPTRPGRGANAAQPAVHEVFAPAAMQAQQEQWNRDYEQQQLLARLSAETRAGEQLRGTVASLNANLQDASAALTARQRELQQREAALATLSGEKAKAEAEKSRIETEKAQIERERVNLTQALSKVETQLVALSSEKTELTRRTAQLGQTVASQQDTIKTLADDVRASQIRLEQQFVQATDNQRELQDTIAGLAAQLEAIQAELTGPEREELTKVVTAVAKGQQELNASVQEFVKTGPVVTQGLENLQTGQTALREQAVELAKKVEAIQARKPGPFNAVKSARLELQIAMAKRDYRDAPVSRYRATAFPFAVKVDSNRVLIVMHGQALGLNWWALSPAYAGGEMVELKHVARREGPPPWSATLDGNVSRLKADGRIVALEVAGDFGMELAGSDAVLKSDLRNLHVFKSNAAGLSFEAEIAPDLTDSRYLIVRRPLRGLAAWLENPAYRADTGDYVVTPDGKLVGIMVTREKCLLLTRENIADYSATVPLNNKSEFLKQAGTLAAR